MSEIPKNWREQGANIRFDWQKKKIDDEKERWTVAEHLREGQYKFLVFKFPGGEIPLVGGYEQIKERFARRGFSEEMTEEILFYLGFWEGITAETAIPVGEVSQSYFKLVRSEVGK